ncbi:MAG TPA: SpaA isopeptide-forming pilin-related protein [Chthoniobacterales bacterium]|jgi:hypothetical protein
MNRFFLGLVFTFFPLLGFAQTQPAAKAATSGIEGTITISPVRGGPVRQGAATSQPLADTAFEVKHDGQVVASFQTDANGQFKVMLPPGHYTISRQQKATAIGSYGPFEADVSAGKLATVHWDCDSGLR